MKTVTLTLIFVYRIYSRTKKPKLLEIVKTEHQCSFSGKNKADCRSQAKQNFRIGNQWLQEWKNTPITNID
jgi:hypothetical protein